MTLEAKGGTIEEQLGQLSAHIEASCRMYPDRFPGISEEREFKMKLRKDGTIRLIDPPFHTAPTWPQETKLSTANPQVKEAYKRADFRYFSRKFPSRHLRWDDCEKYMWADLVDITDRCGRSEIPTLSQLCMRKLSAFQMAFGKTNGHPHVIAASDGMMTGKYQDALLSMSRPPLPGRVREPIKYLGEAMDWLYRQLGVNLENKIPFKLSLRPLRGAYLGAASGQNYSAVRKIITGEDLEFPVKVAARGKKIDSISQDLEDMLEYLNSGKEPGITWVCPPKVENFFSFVKQQTDEEFASWCRKLRIFNIPNSIFNHLERLTCYVRHLKERGRVIRIGHRWPKGGADSIARCLGIELENHLKPILVEGDAKLFDQTVRDLFVNLYFSTMGVHFDKDSEDYPAFERIVKFLLKNMLDRITKLFGDMWGIVHGGVPSGAYNTSHMDSWIMAMYFALFGVYQLHTAPEEMRESLELHLYAQIRLVVYGDDHLYNKGEGPESTFFSGTLFAKFMKDHFDVEIRDMKDGVTFLSDIREGILMRCGATFLKHQFVLNPVKGNGQCTYLPFRETAEFIVRSAWSRDTRQRDVIDVILSVLGQAYATYASNEDAYRRLLLIYEELVATVGSSENLSQLLQDRLGHDDIKKARQQGLSPEDLCGAFPTWDTLVKKNIYDESYQEITIMPMDYNDLYDVSDNWWNEL